MTALAPGILATEPHKATILNKDISGEHTAIVLFDPRSRVAWCVRCNGWRRFVWAKDGFHCKHLMKG